MVAKKLSKKQRELKKTQRGLVALKILMVVLSVLLYWMLILILNYKAPELEKDSVRYQGIIDACSNKSLFDSATCINQITKTFYKYKVTEDSDIEMGFEDLYSKGGDCKNWAEYYCKIGKEYGFYTSQPRFKTGTYNVELTNGKNITYEVSHTFCIWAMSGEGYVILDEKGLTKFQFEGEPDLSLLEEEFKKQERVNGTS